VKGFLRQTLVQTLVASLALHAGFMGYTLTQPPSAELTPAMASQRYAKFIIARFPTPPRPPEKVVRVAVIPPPAIRPAKKSPPKAERKMTQPARRTPPPPKVAKVTPPEPAPAPSAIEPPPPTIITSKMAEGDVAEVQVVSVSSAKDAGAEGPALQANPAPNELPYEDLDEASTVASSEHEPGPDLPALRRGYIGRLGKYFRRIRRYPRRARRAGLEGTVLLEVVLDERGRILEVRVIESSGHKILDDAAKAAVAQLGVVPSPPGELAWGAQAVRIPFHYNLRN
jgi:protein TonB